MCPHLKFLLPGFCRYVSCLSTSLEQRLSGFRQYFRLLPPAGQCRQDSGSVSYWSAESYGLSSNRTGFTCDSTIPADYKTEGRGFPREVSPFASSFKGRIAASLRLTEQMHAIHDLITGSQHPGKLYFIYAGRKRHKTGLHAAAQLIQIQLRSLH